MMISDILSEVARFLRTVHLLTLFKDVLSFANDKSEQWRYVLKEL